MKKSYWSFLNSSVILCWISWKKSRFDFITKSKANKDNESYFQERRLLLYWGIIFTQIIIILVGLSFWLIPFFSLVILWNTVCWISFKVFSMWSVLNVLFLQQSRIITLCAYRDVSGMFTTENKVSFLAKEETAIRAQSDTETIIQDIR